MQQVKNPTAPATEAQRNLVAKLAAELHGDAAEAYLSHPDVVTALETRAGTSELISGLIAASKVKRADQGRKADAELPAEGYYAADYQGALRFYVVKAGSGRWAGRTFLNRYRSDNEDRVFRAEMSAFAAAMADETAAAAARMRFATETVRCFRCGRRLTDEVSRARGVGPECAKML